MAIAFCAWWSLYDRLIVRCSAIMNDAIELRQRFTGQWCAADLQQPTYACFLNVEYQPMSVHHSKEVPMRYTPLPLLLVCMSLFLLSSCQTLGSAPKVPSAELGELVEIKYQAEADGRHLKEIKAKDPELTIMQRLSGMIGKGKDPQQTFAKARELYNKVYSAQISGISTVQRSIEMGRDSADYASALASQIQRAQEHQQVLSEYTTENFGSSRGVKDLIESEEGQLVINTVKDIWRARKEEMQEERQNASDALESEKMVSFDEL